MVVRAVGSIVKLGCTRRVLALKLLLSLSVSMPQGVSIGIGLTGGSHPVLIQQETINAIFMCRIGTVVVCWICGLKRGINYINTIAILFPPI